MSNTIRQSALQRETGTDLPRKGALGQLSRVPRPTSAWTAGARLWYTRAMTRGAEPAPLPVGRDSRSPARGRDVRTDQTHTAGRRVTRERVCLHRPNGLHSRPGTGLPRPAPPRRAALDH